MELVDLHRSYLTAKRSVCPNGSKKQHNRVDSTNEDKGDGK